MITRSEAILYRYALRCACERPKKKGNCFCAACFGRLPREIRNQLPPRENDRYSEALEAAIEKLNIVFPAEHQHAEAP